MAAIFPVPTTRTSDQLSQIRLLTQLQADSLDLLRLQQQISTGRRVLTPSEDAPAAQRAIRLQRLLELKAQVQVNVVTNRSYLDATDAAIGSVSQLLSDLRATVQSVATSTVTDSARQAAAAELQHGLQELLHIGNQQFRERYLFAGGKTTTQPFAFDEHNRVVYSGNDLAIRTYADLELLFEANATGQEVFGVYSAQVRGGVDLNPIVDDATLLADLRGGRGVTKGSLAISDGTATSVVDISGAETLGDVAALLEAHPPAGRTITARVTSHGLWIDIDNAGGGNLSIREVGSGTTAAELGILSPLGTGVGPVAGAALDPALRPTTRLADVLGSRATATLFSPAANNDIVLRARRNGAELNGVQVQFVDDGLLHASPGLVAGSEAATYSETAVAARAALSFSGFNNNLVLTAAAAGSALNNVRIEVTAAGAIGNAAQVTYDATGKVLRIGVDSGGATQIQTVISAINGQGAFTAAYDASDPVDGGYVPTAAVSASDAGVVSGNTGHSGGDPRTIYVTIDPGATRADHVVAALRASATIDDVFDVQFDDRDTSASGAAGLGLVDLDASATFAYGSGADLDLASGLRIVQGEATYVVDVSNAETVEDLLNAIRGSGAQVLADINESGTGIDIRSRLSGVDFFIGENGGLTATQLGVRSLSGATPLAQLNHGRGVDAIAGPEFTIVRSDGTSFDIDVSGADTLQDVIDAVNQHAGNQDSARRVVAQLARQGNGLELVEDNPSGSGVLTIVKAFSSRAAIDLGLVAAGQEQAVGTAAAAAAATLTFPSPADANTALRLVASQAGTGLNGVQIVFQDTQTGDVATAAYDSGARQLVISLDASATTANTILSAINAEGTFSATLDTTSDLTNDGSGVPGASGAIAATAGGAAGSLTGVDVNPVEVEGVFNTLVRLKDAVENFDLGEIERLIDSLDADYERLNFARADLGSRGRTLDTIQSRLEDEEIQLRDTLSQEIDVDFVDAVSQLTAKQASLQAALQLAARSFQLSLLNYL